MVSKWRSNPLPVGQTIETTYPLSRNVVASCQTRRSKGEGRFSTRMSIRRPLPADAVIPAGLALAIRDSYEIDDRLARPQSIEDASEFFGRVADHQQLGELGDLSHG